jgi:hypothetical protein
LDYGSDIWIFKDQSVIDRSTFSAIDSFEITPRGRTSDYDRNVPAWGNVVVSAKHLPTLSVFFYNYFHQLLTSPMVPTWAPGLPYDYNTQVGRNPEWKRIRDMAAYRASRYLETQIWGPLDLSHVDTLIFTQYPPDAALVELLTSHGIKILDGRKMLWSH